MTAQENQQVSQQVNLSASGVSVTLGGRSIIENIDLTLTSGEFTVLLGPNGAGKTTLARALAGLIPCTGSIALDGRPLSAMPLRERARHLAYLPQGHVFHWPMPVENIVALGREPYADDFSQASEADRVAVGTAMAATSVTDFARRSIDTLSGGEKARVAVARALATQAPILIADEPTASLDMRHQLSIMTLLRKIAHDGAAVLAIVHDLALAMRFADRTVMLNHGHIVANGPPREVITPQLIGDAFGIAVDRVETPEGSLLLPARALWS